MRDSFLRWVATRHAILVPSLVADKRVDDVAAEANVVTEAEHQVEGAAAFESASTP
jgi:hypothetical protein